MRRALVFLTFGSLAGVPVWAQNIVSAQSGLIHYVEGRVLMDGQAVEVKFTNFPALKEKSALTTEEGRAEILLGPGSFVRIGENSTIRMLSNRLTDTRLEFVSGAMILEVASIPKESQIVVAYKDKTVTVAKNGLYRLDSEPAQLRVYEGEAAVEAGGHVMSVKTGKLLPFDGVMAVEKFNNQVGDALNRWSRRRSESLAMVNISSAKYLRDNSLYGSGGWMFNRYFGMFTFVPLRGTVYSPYGFRFWNCYDVYDLYMPRMVYRGFSGPNYNSNLGYMTMPRTSGGFSGTVASSASAPAASSTSAAAAASAPVSRGGGEGGSRGR